MRRGGAHPRPVVLLHVAACRQFPAQTDQPACLRHSACDAAPALPHPGMPSLPLSPALVPQLPGAWMTTLLARARTTMRTWTSPACVSTSEGCLSLGGVPAGRGPGAREHGVAGLGAAKVAPAVLCAAVAAHRCLAIWLDSPGHQWLCGHALPAAAQVAACSLPAGSPPASSCSPSFKVLKSWVRCAQAGLCEGQEGCHVSQVSIKPAGSRGAWSAGPHSWRPTGLACVPVTVCLAGRCSSCLMAACLLCAGQRGSSLPFIVTLPRTACDAA